MRTWKLAALLILVTGAVMLAHWPALSATTLWIDDRAYLVDNPLVQRPSWDSARRFLAEVLEPSTVAGYYQPLTMISLMLDVALGGRPDDLRMFRVTNLALHVLTSVLVLLLLNLLFGHAPAAAAGALLFGLHPLLAELIPWVSERKTLLAGCFSLCCLVLYVLYARPRASAGASPATPDPRRRRGLYGGCLLAYGLALLSKPSSTPLPLLLILLDFWPLGRLRGRTLLEKLPFLALGAAAAAVTVISQGRTAMQETPLGRPWHFVPLLLANNLFFYLSKIVWPAKLSAYYPFPDPLTLADPFVLASVVAMALLAAAMLVSLRWTRAGLVAGLFFFLAILPSLHLIQFTWVFAANKHVYLPVIGLLLLVAPLLRRMWTPAGATAAAALVPRSGPGRAALAAVALLALAEGAAVRWYQPHWRSLEARYRYELALAHPAGRVTAELANNLANVIWKSQGPTDEAIALYRRAGRADPSFPKSFYNLGHVLIERRRFDEAVNSFSTAVRIKPDYAEALYHLGVLYGMQEQFPLALDQFRAALAVKPDYADARNGLGLALLMQGQTAEAEAVLRALVADQPNDLPGRLSLCDLLRRQGRMAEALEQCDAAARLSPDDPRVRVARAALRSTPSCP